MEIGFLTNCFRQRRLPEIIQWAGANGFHALEVACWRHDPSKVDPSLDVVDFNRAKADALNALAEENGIRFTCLTYCENTLAHDPARREIEITHLRRIIDAAHLLGVNTVCAFIGRDQTKTPRENFDEMEHVFAPLLEYAAARGVRIAIENCPMVGWQFEGLPGNLAYAPHIWDEMFRRLPHKNFGLNLDPSHLAWLGVDYLDALRRYRDRIFYTHAKDTQIDTVRRAYFSILDSGSRRWWTYRIPGTGVIDWRAWCDALRDIGYDGTLSIEHEDPDYWSNEDKIKEGLLLSRKNLQQAMSSS